MQDARLSFATRMRIVRLVSLFIKAYCERGICVMACFSIIVSLLFVDYPLTPPEVSPETIYFCTLKKIKSSGMDVRIDAAVNIGQLRL